MSTTETPNVDPFDQVIESELEKRCSYCDRHFTTTATVREGRLYCTVACAELDDRTTIPQSQLAQLEEQHEAHIVGWIPADADCSRMRLAIKSGIAAHFQKDPDHVEFYEPPQETPSGRQVPVFLSHSSQTPAETRESIYQWVRGCVYGRLSR